MVRQRGYASDATQIPNQESADRWIMIFIESSIEGQLAGSLSSRSAQMGAWRDILRQQRAAQGGHFMYL
jgi:hypothetical protein